MIESELFERYPHLLVMKANELHNLREAAPLMEAIGESFGTVFASSGRKPAAWFVMQPHYGSPEHRGWVLLGSMTEMDALMARLRISETL